LDYVEFGTIDGDYFVQALGYNPHIPLHSDPLKLKDYLDTMGLKVSQIMLSYRHQRLYGGLAAHHFSFTLLLSKSRAKNMVVPLVIEPHLGTPYACSCLWGFSDGMKSKEIELTQ
jgi:hypothetical protein